MIHEISADVSYGWFLSNHEEAIFQIVADVSDPLKSFISVSELIP